MRFTETTAAAIAPAKGTQKPSSAMLAETFTMPASTELPLLRIQSTRKNSALRPAQPASASGTHACFLAAMKFQIQIPRPAMAARMASLPLVPALITEGAAGSAFICCFMRSAMGPSIFTLIEYPLNKVVH